jgi:C-terminal processing protease CtpA/Prc
LVWEIKPGTDTSETLHRGDELLAVDGQLVEGKKLDDIYKLILCKVPAEVKLKIRVIQHNICNGEGTWYFCTIALITLILPH